MCGNTAVVNNYDNACFQNRLFWPGRQCDVLDLSLICWDRMWWIINNDMKCYATVVNKTQLTTMYMHVCLSLCDFWLPTQCLDYLFGKYQLRWQTTDHEYHHICIIWAGPTNNLTFPLIHLIYLMRTEAYTQLSWRKSKTHRLVQLTTAMTEYPILITRWTLGSNKYFVSH